MATPGLLLWLKVCFMDFWILTLGADRLVAMLAVTTIFKSATQRRRMLTVEDRTVFAGIANCGGQLSI